jgi:hypothetical protein
MKKTILALVISILFIATSIITTTGDNLEKSNRLIDNKIKVTSGETIIIDNSTEYWALLITNLIIYDNDVVVPGFKNLYDILLDSPWWSADHIKVLQEENATKRNIIQGLRWLDSMDDSDDISLVYINTHGGHLYKDLFPYDEEDGFDEVLTTYWSDDFPLTMIRDDELNYYLSRLDSKGVSLILDTCHAGGFNDPPFQNIKDSSPETDSTEHKQNSWLHWSEGFADELRGQNRVVVMASREDELSYFGGLTPAFTDGLRGFADKNMDGMVSAEETFFYAYPRCYQQHPTLFDTFDGELILTKAYTSPPSILGKNNEEVFYQNKGIMNSYNSFTESYSKNSIVCGYITNEKTNETIETVIDLEWHGNGEMEWDADIANNGFFSFNVAAGSFILYLTNKPDYLWAESEWLEIGDNETLWVNLSLIPRFPENSKICGYITDIDTNKPVDTGFHMSWFDGQRHFYGNSTRSNPITGFYSIDTNMGGSYFFLYGSPYTHHLSQNKTFCINVDDNETLWFNFSLKRINMPVKISKPSNALYISDEIVIPFLSPVIIGPITIKVDTTYFNASESDRVEFYIDDVLKYTDNDRPYNWTWNIGGIIKRKHTIKVIAYNEKGDFNADEIDVWKFL